MIQNDENKLVGTPERALCTLLAVEVIEPARVAMAMGDARWIALRAEIGRQLAPADRPDTAVWTGQGSWVAAYQQPAIAVERSALLMQAAQEKGLAMRACIHAGEVSLDGESPQGVAVLVALEAARQATAAETIVTQPAAAMPEIGHLGLQPIARWKVPGLGITWTLFSSGNRRFELAASGTAAGLLSDRELQVVSLLVTGNTNREISAALDIAVGTVERHIANILKKLGFRSRAQIARWAVESGLVAESTQAP